MNETSPPPKRRWVNYRFGSELPPLEPFDLSPVADIPIRQAVEEGALKMNKELAMYITSCEWNGHPPRTPVIAGVFEEGKPFAVWVGRKNAFAKNKDANPSDSETDEIEAQPSDSPPQIDATPDDAPEADAHSSGDPQTGDPQTGDPQTGDPQTGAPRTEQHPPPAAQ